MREFDPCRFGVYAQYTKIAKDHVGNMVVLP